MVKIDRDRPIGARRDDRVHIGHQPVVRHALIIERRQHQRARKAELGGAPRQRHRVGERRRTGADHQAIHRQAGRLIGQHHAIALRERERGRLAGGAQHVEPIAAVIEQEPRQRSRSRAIGFAAGLDGRRHRSDHAGKSSSAHACPPVELRDAAFARRLAQPLIL